MTTALRTHQFYAGTPAAGGWTDAYTVPAGKTINLKGIVAFNPSTTLTAIAAVRLDPAQTMWQVTLASLGTQQFQPPYFVFGPGQTIAVFNSTGRAVAYVLSGYLLTI